jgi:hypothetical protein
MTEKTLDPVRRLRWFKDARFGMFVHLGLYRPRIPGEGRDDLAGDHAGRGAS